MSRNEVFVPEKFNKQEVVYKPWVQSYVKTEIGKLSSAFIKTDGSNEPTSDINFNQHTVTNVRESNDKHEPVIRKELDEVYGIIDPIYKKSSTPIRLTDVKVSTSSDYGGEGPYGKIKNLIDGDLRSQWIIKKEDVDTYVWVLFEFITPKQIYRCDLIPRSGKQQVTHTLKEYTLEGSNDRTTFSKIFESSEVVDQDRHFEFDVTPRYKYFKLTGTGNQQFGLTAIKFYEATLKSLDDPMYIETYELRATGEISVHPELRIKNRQISGLRKPKRNDQVANKGYVDDQVTEMKLFAGRMMGKVRRAAFTYAGSNLSPGDQLRLVSKHNKVGALANGTLTVTELHPTDKAILHVSIQLKRMLGTENEVDVYLKYSNHLVGDRTHENAVYANLPAGEIMKLTSGILDVKKGGQIRLIADSVIPDLNVIVEMEMLHTP